MYHCCFKMVIFFLETPMFPLPTVNISIPGTQNNEILTVSQIQKEMEKYIPMPLLVQQNMNRFQPIQPIPNKGHRPMV